MMEIMKAINFYLKMSLKFFYNWYRSNSKVYFKKTNLLIGAIIPPMLNFRIYICKQL
jgi:hypothetical protein